MTSIYVNWGESKVKLTWNRHLMPQRALITSVHGFCFRGSELLLVDLNHRGWDIPGGHIEPEESPEQCFRREALEEGYVEGNSELLGAVTVDHSDNPLWNESGPYPLVGYQVFYGMKILRLLPFEAQYESSRRMFVPPQDVSSYYEGWNALHQEMLDNALSQFAPF
ncbi:NUDIX hydrolase [Cohnella nanjingensis]|uniref:NUDIX domain-containing protein n=1 Tax=Cohnella nanjingensis TaxID=1387779 RepID=A0A7X0VES4_9BACL|nr:NUDIX domain-containing protein [Cohnella nanjingensis]MBB6671302.1 NUDIX domain-containing protein [Cohnella nanjingensis]